jgi:hypothetical protein
MDDKGWTNTLNKLDSFGVSYNFQINSKDKFKTTLGALFTLIYYLVILILFLELGKDVYERTKPKVSLNTDIKDYQAVQLSNKNFTYGYRVEDNDGLQLIEDTKFQQKVLFFQYEIKNGSWNNLIFQYLPRKKCSEIPNYKEKEAYFNISLESWNCIDFDNITLGGNWDGNFVYGLEIKTEQCQNDTSSNVICSSQEEIKNYFSPEGQGRRIFYSDLSMEVYPSMDDYNAPLKTHLVNNYELLNIGLNKRNVKTYKSTQMINDIGWFFPDYLTQDLIISTETIFHDFTFKSEKSIQLFNQYLYLGRKVDTYNRSYYKIQEALAAVGGFSRILFIFLSLFFNYAAQTYRSLFLLSNLFYENENEEIKKTDNKNLNITVTNNNLNSNNACNNSDLNRLNLFNNEFNRKKFLVNSTNMTNMESKNKFVMRTEGKTDNNNSNLVNIKSENNNIKNKNEIVNKKKVFETDVQINSIKKPVKILFLDFFKAKYCCIKNKNQNVNNTLIMIKDYQSYFSRCLDILTYFKIQNEFRNFKHILLDEQQRDMIEVQNHNKIYEKFGRNISLDVSKLNK